MHILGRLAIVQAVRKRLPPPQHPLANGQDAAPGSCSDDPVDAAAAQQYVPPAEYVARDEVFKVP